MDHSRNTQDGPNNQPSEQEGLTTHLLFYWFLVGASLTGLWSAVINALSISLPMSTVTAGALVLTGLVAALWLAGFRPSLHDCLFYFVTQAVISLAIVQAFPSLTSNPWENIILELLSNFVAVALGFTNVGRRGRSWVRIKGSYFIQSLST